MNDPKFRFFLKILQKIKKNQFLRFCLVGGFCASQNILIIYLLTGLFKVHYIFSIFLQTVFVNSIGFYLNSRYTFNGNKNEFWQELFKYHTVMLSSILTVSILMYVLVDILHIWYLYAFITLTIAMTIYNFIAHKKWTFK
jgi:putative flippase GtrA